MVTNNQSSLLLETLNSFLRMSTRAATIMSNGIPAIKSKTSSSVVPGDEINSIFANKKGVS